MRGQTPGLDVVGRGFHFAESPRWRAGTLYCSDLFGRQVFAIQPDGGVRALCTVPNMPSGLGFSPDGALLIVSMKDSKVLRFDGNALSQAADLSSVTPYQCNDMLVDERGRAYVGNFGWHPGESKMRPTSLSLVLPSGQCQDLGGAVNFPNGICRSADGRTLIVAESFASRLSAFDIRADGTLANQRVWASLSDKTFTTVSEALESGDPLPDGLALDAEGAVWVADSGGHAALRVAAGGKFLEKIEVGDMAVFGLTLGGTDRRTLFLCIAPSVGKANLETERESIIVSYRVRVPGVGLP
jgi:sugar lactone lactonase YvrE